MLKRLLKKFRKGTAAKNRTEANRLALLRSLPKNAVGAEIGVHEGEFSRNILKIAAPRKLFLIDPWMFETGEIYEKSWFGGQGGQDQQHMDDRYNRVLRTFSDEISAGTVSVIRQASEQAMREMEDHSLDFVYIDGNHLYDFVKKDLILSFSKVRPGGIISGDDYAPGDWWAGGVKQAVDELVAQQHALTLKVIGNQFVLTKSA